MFYYFIVPVCSDPLRDGSLLFLILGLYSWYCFLSSPLFNFLFPYCCVDIEYLGVCKCIQAFLSFGLNWFWFI